jgi:DegV family protein with EDD domain
VEVIIDKQTRTPIFTKEQKVSVLTDSVAQVPAELAVQMGISVVPLVVQINGKLYHDGIDLDLAELYKRMREEKIIPSTIAPAPGEFKDAMSAAFQAGARELLCITLSSKLSSCYNNACLAADLIREENPESRIEVLDSLNAAASEGFMVTAAARAAARGDSLQAIMQAAREVRSRTSLVASFETLEYLARGGRIGKVAYMMGSLINIKPVVTVDKDGTVAPVVKARSMQHALQAMLDYVEKKVKGCRKLYLTILEADAAEQASRLRDLALTQLKPVEIQNSVFTPVMGVHTGPGLIGLVYYFE